MEHAATSEDLGLAAGEEATGLPLQFPYPVPELATDRIAELLTHYLSPVPEELLEQLSAYLDLLVRWNARTNLTAVRDPEEMVTRHFGESLFAATTISPFLAESASLLDFGSGAGFPGLPMQLFRPDLRVTLAESQNKKATFLREVVRTLGLRTTVLGARVETLPAAARFDAITLRAVDCMPEAIATAVPYLADGGIVAVLSGDALFAAPELKLISTHPIPRAQQTQVALYRKA